MERNELGCLLVSTMPKERLNLRDQVVRQCPMRDRNASLHLQSEEKKSRFL